MMGWYPEVRGCSNQSVPDSGTVGGQVWNWTAEPPRFRVVRSRNACDSTWWVGFATGQVQTGDNGPARRETHRYNPLPITRTTPDPFGLTKSDMSVTIHDSAGKADGGFVTFPDPPRNYDERNCFEHLALSGAAYCLDWHFGTPETILIDGLQYIAPDIRSEVKGLPAPDMLIAFDVNPDTSYRRNAYVVAEHGKPPDFVLEIASASTGLIDVRDKPVAYAALGVPEYWRFDETGEHHGARLAGDRLAEDRYEPIGITELADGSLEGYSEVLDLYLRWEEGRLEWHDPATGKAIMSMAEMQRIIEGERQVRLAVEQAATERQGRLEAEQRAEVERQARLAVEQAAEERVRELEEKLRRRVS